MSDSKASAPPASILLLDDGAGTLTPISNKQDVLNPAPNQGGYISGTPEASPPDSQLRWRGVNTAYERNANAEDERRRARFANKRETAVAAPAPENTAMVLAHNWGVSYPLVARIIALEGVVASLAQGQVRLQESLGALLNENFELRQHIDQLFSKITRP
jgi:hypothetical protein